MTRSLAQTDPLIVLPIVVGVFIGFGCVYVLITGYFFPRIYKSYRARTLVCLYLSNALYRQLLWTMGICLITLRLSELFYKYVVLCSRRLLFDIKARTFNKVTKVKDFNQVRHRSSKRLLTHAHSVR